MRANRTITKETAKGKIEIIIEVRKSVTELDKNFDGYIIGKETIYINTQHFTVKLNGKEVQNSQSLTRMGTYPGIEKNPQFNDIRKANSYGYLTPNFGLTEATYNEIKKALEDCIVEVTTEETMKQDAIIEEKKAAEKKAIEEDRKEYKRLIDSGMCPKCGTWCYGDCEANK